MRKKPRDCRAWLGLVGLRFQEEVLMGWKLFQAAIFGSIIVLSIEYKWQADGLAIGVLAGMTAWYATGLANGLVLLGRRLVGRSAPQSRRPAVGHLDGWAREVGLLDKPERGGSSVRGQQ